MIDLSELEKYKENNRIEAKQASGGLPRSIWETYSAFANTLGGIILLGVEELKDKSLSAIGITNTDWLINDFWDIINNSKKVSLNILSDKDIYVETINGKKIIVINVPKAQRSEKPIYIDNNPLSGSYRRNGEGDYHCTKEEVQAMLRDASYKTQDMLVLDNMDNSVFDYESVKSYRIRMKYSRPNHVWGSLDDEDFLMKLGAIGRGNDGKYHPTAAGLLMFGYEYEIVKEFPAYFLDYQEQFDDDTRWTDRIVSSSGDWSGNIYDFFFRVYNKITQDIKVPFKVKNGIRIDTTPVHTALREAIANCLINADYYGRQGLVIIKQKNQISLSNPGGFRIDIEAAKSGGISDPRNAVLIKMFNMIDIGERAGSGIPNIYHVWSQQGWNTPTITESFDPERITLSLSINKCDDKKVAINNGDKKVTINNGDKKVTINNGDKKTITDSQKKVIIEYLTNNSTGKTSDFTELLGVKATRVKNLLTEMINENIIVPIGANRNRMYKLTNIDNYSD